MFRLSHSQSLRIRVQILRLIFFLAKSTEISNNGLVDRYYKALYDLMNSYEILNSKCIKEYLKLIMTSLMKDDNCRRIQVMLKRFLQTSFLAEPQVICCILIIVSHVIDKNKSLKDHFKSIKLLEMDSDRDKDKDKKINSAENSNILEIYMKRDPRYGILESLTELSLLKNHYHPTVSKWANEIIDKSLKNSKEPIGINYAGDPLVDFSLINFLHKFIVKNPKSNNKKSKKSNNDVEKNENEGEFIDTFNSYNKESESVVLKRKNKKSAYKDIDDFADHVIEDEMNRLDPDSKNLGDIDEDLDLNEGDDNGEDYEDDFSEFDEENEDDENDDEYD